MLDVDDVLGVLVDLFVKDSIFANVDVNSNRKALTMHNCNPSIRCPCINRATPLGVEGSGADADIM